jgi:hypothetical protein
VVELEGEFPAVLVTGGGGLGGVLERSQDSARGSVEDELPFASLFSDARHGHVSE